MSEDTSDEQVLWYALTTKSQHEKKAVEALDLRGFETFLPLYRARRQWSDTVNTGITFFVIFLYTKFFDWWWESMPKWLFFFVLGLAAILILLVLKRLRRSGAGGRAS